MYQYLLDRRNPTGKKTPGGAGYGSIKSQPRTRTLQPGLHVQSARSPQDGPRRHAWLEAGDTAQIAGRWLASHPSEEPSASGSAWSGSVSVWYGFRKSRPDQWPRLCDPCAYVRPCVPCVSRLPPVSSLDPPNGVQGRLRSALSLGASKNVAGPLHETATQLLTSDLAGRGK